MEYSLVEKLFGLLEASAGHESGRSLAELASEARLAKPTAHRILKTLVAMGYMERVAAGVYRQTDQLRRLVSVAGDDRIVRNAHPALRQLHEQTRETVNLGVLRQDRVVYLTVLDSPQPLRRTVNPAMSDPFSCTALGRAIVAHLPSERQAYLLGHIALEKRTNLTEVDPSRLKATFSEVRENGFALETGETDIGVACIGAPVFDRDGVVAAISVSAPTARLEGGRLMTLTEMVKSTAHAISARLKHGEDL